MSASETRTVKTYLANFVIAIVCRINIARLGKAAWIRARVSVLVGAGSVTGQVVNVIRRSALPVLSNGPHEKDDTQHSLSTDPSTYFSRCAAIWLKTVTASLTFTLLDGVILSGALEGLLAETP